MLNWFRGCRYLISWGSGPVNGTCRADFGDPAAAPSFSTEAQYLVGTLVRSLRCLLATMLLILGLYNPWRLF